MKLMKILALSFSCSLFLTSTLLATEVTDVKPLTLKEIMQGLSKDTQLIAEGIFTEDFKLIKKAARNIAKHPKAPIETRVTLAKVLGAEMSQFKTFDSKVHNSAVEIGLDAEEQDITAVLLNYHLLIDGCLACHNNFKQRVITILNPSLSGELQ